MEEVKQILINLKQENPYIYECFIEDIEAYLHTLCEGTKRNWKHSKLNLNKREIIILKECLKNTKTENISNLRKIKKSIKEYINKMKYKEILKNNYDKLEDLITDGYILNRLKGENINYIGELIELTDEELDSINRMGQRKIEKIKSILKEKNIIRPNNQKTLKEHLKQENAGIIPPSQKTKTRKEEIEEELKNAYLLYYNYRGWMKIQEKKIKELESELENLKQTSKK